MAVLPIVFIAVTESKSDALFILALLLRFVGIFFWIWGCMDYAESKGQNKWLGIIGIVGLIGLIILAVLKDQYVMTPPPMADGSYPRHPGNYS